MLSICAGVCACACMWGKHACGGCACVVFVHVHRKRKEGERTISLNHYTTTKPCYGLVHTSRLTQLKHCDRNLPVVTAVLMATVFRFGRCGTIPCAFPLKTLPNLPLPTALYALDSQGKCTVSCCSKRPMVRSSHTKHFLKLQISSRKLKLLEFLQPR